MDIDHLIPTRIEGLKISHQEPENNKIRIFSVDGYIITDKHH